MYFLIGFIFSALYVAFSDGKYLHVIGLFIAWPLYVLFELLRYAKQRWGNPPSN